jgi:hypothetical protein
MKDLLALGIIVRSGSSGQKHHSETENCPILDPFPPEHNHFPCSGPGLGPSQVLDFINSFTCFISYLNDLPGKIPPRPPLLKGGIFLLPLVKGGREGFDGVISFVTVFMKGYTKARRPTTWHHVFCKSAPRSATKHRSSRNPLGGDPYLSASGSYRGRPRPQAESPTGSPSEYSLPIYPV